LVIIKQYKFTSPGLFSEKLPPPYINSKYKAQDSLNWLRLESTFLVQALLQNQMWWSSLIILQYWHQAFFTAMTWSWEFRFFQCENALGSIFKGDFLVFNPSQSCWSAWPLLADRGCWPVMIQKTWLSTIVANIFKECNTPYMMLKTSFESLEKK
jgi:hypothetical protein